MDDKELVYYEEVKKLSEDYYFATIEEIFKNRANTLYKKLEDIKNEIEKTSEEMGNFEQSSDKTNFSIAKSDLETLEEKNKKLKIEYAHAQDKYNWIVDKRGLIIDYIKSDE